MGENRIADDVAKRAAGERVFHYVGGDKANRPGGNLPLACSIIFSAASMAVMFPAPVICASRGSRTPVPVPASSTVQHRFYFFHGVMVHRVPFVRQAVKIILRSQRRSFLKPYNTWYHALWSNTCFLIWTTRCTQAGTGWKTMSAAALRNLPPLIWA
jgi:hypothetical protein